MLAERRITFGCGQDGLVHFNELKAYLKLSMEHLYSTAESYNFIIEAENG